MADNDNEEWNLEEFMRSAKERQARLAAMNKHLHSAVRTEQDEVEEPSYPHLSPLTEEGDTVATSQYETTRQDESLNTTDLRRENISPENDTDLNYSSDLSLDSETVSNNTTATNEVYRAEPVRCHSPPTDYLGSLQQPLPHYGSPRKASAPAQEAKRAISDTRSEQYAPLQERQPDQRAVSLQSLESDEQKLHAQIRIFEQNISEIKKALEECKYGTPQHIDAARLLKIAECKHRLSTCHKSMLEKGMKKKSDSLGSLKITDLKFRMTDKFREELAKPGNNHNFFCIASCGAVVQATKLIDTTSVKQQASKDFMEFSSSLLKDDLHFKSLPPDFIVKLELFELIIHPGGRGAIIKDGFEKFSALATPSKKAKTSKEVPRFKSIGNLRLTRKREDHRTPKLSRMTDDENSKYITREYQLQMELRPEQMPSKSGMLNVRYLDDLGRPDWTRCWVQISNGQIRFWKSKQDALDGKEPNEILEMKNLCTNTVRKMTVDDELYRQHSFMLYSKFPLSGPEQFGIFQRVLKDENYKIVRHQLAADDKDGRESWCMELDKSIYCFSEWHDRICTYTMEEIQDIFYY